MLATFRPHDIRDPVSIWRLRAVFDRKLKGIEDKLYEKGYCIDIDEGEHEAVTELMTGIVRLYIYRCNDDSQNSRIINIVYAVDYENEKIELIRLPTLDDYEGTI